MNRMTTMIDCAADTTSRLDCLKAAGVQTIARYYQYVNHPDLPSKKLSWREAALIAAAGLQIVPVWENGLPTTASYFSFTKGQADGLGALQQAFVVGQPRGTAIYFTVDGDLGPQDTAGVITDYFKGVADSIAGSYAVGVYGSGAVCEAILDADLASRAWLAGATGWRGSHGFARWSIKQGLETTMCGLTVDPNETDGDPGSFVPQAQATV